MEVKQKVKENTVYDDRKERASTDDFGRAISRIAAAQICENIGFEGFNESALDSFADITVKYLYDLGKTATFCAILAGRTEVNVFDVIEGLGDLGGSTGASKNKRKIPCFVQMDETPAFKHIPLWMPAFPDRHTYARASTWNERASDP
ncbi:PREDICTED: transcription initiation factor TFIID subunit 8-like [Nicotiana attenuata]|uniref:transcription initiation factor TFIID subunit 8-like n=1 Tax=Nicotiana attenuata TaxID=49451 RepID=UPI000905B623|nr:PREDICTED: transcription initiation factor TFIID subunit 8-like [Nicotiana attenuata]